ncbi:short chain dehydrogenase [Parasphingorhabdus marina DSM 22363]|uniref:Short chain dehydrogenase n=1 Tax=Parasphingorhabdus marina DSM 22363 TaxID=1123272 RepID=A0A1N6D1H2_9SPHN|nr:SDR family NAD(P)-dependent oxidoreductase [Parasphingorhabdus marina]SIN64589.1 short chain dehydrogenase [Parasphingorhabdus marina DSM 22363]
MEFDGKAMVITGGATGIGFALARALGNEGAAVIIAEPREHRLQEAVEKLSGEGIRADHFVCDVTDLAQVEALADFAWDQGRPVGGIVNNAGVAHPRSRMHKEAMDDVRSLFDVNFFGVWHGCSVFARRLAEQGTPAGIYNTGSENSLFVAAPGSAAYVASKHAVLGLTDALRDEVPEYIKIGIICPGFVQSELVSKELMPMAMPADKFASIIVRQMKDDRFFLVSHSYNIERVDHRHAEITSAYEGYAPRYDGDEEYDIRTLIEKLRAAQSAKAELD